jgi:DNA-binding CsgD family transcriptional regulator/PAS domain-containing protein
MRTSSLNKSSLPSSRTDDGQRDLRAVWCEAVGASPLALGLVELPSSRIIELSQRAAELLGTTRENGTTLDYLAIVEPRQAAEDTLRLLSTGGLESIQALWRLKRVDGSVIDVFMCGRAIRASVGTDLGLFVAVDAVADKERPAVTAELLSVLDGDAAAPFAFMDADDDEVDASAARKRVAELEHRLQRIAVEIQAAGVLRVLGPTADALRAPALSELSRRQWDVVSRLARGERVSMIATELYLSQSTVRNHLSAIFRKVGVHSQRELLALLRPD